MKRVWWAVWMVACAHGATEADGGADAGDELGAAEPRIGIVFEAPRYEPTDPDGACPPWCPVLNPPPHEWQ